MRGCQGNARVSGTVFHDCFYPQTVPDTLAFTPSHSPLHFPLTPSHFPYFLSHHSQTHRRQHELGNADYCKTSAWSGSFAAACAARWAFGFRLISFLPVSMK